MVLPFASGGFQALGASPGVPSAGAGASPLADAGEPRDAVEAYFECITACSLDDGACVTTCTAILRDAES